MEPETARPYALKAGEGRTYAGLSPGFVIKAGERGRGRRLAFVEFTTRMGEEPGPHTHASEDEIFFVLEGDVTFRCGSETFEATDGSFVFLPRGIEHDYTLTSDGDVRMLVVTSPADEEASGGWGGFVGDLEAEGEA